MSKKIVIFPIFYLPSSDDSKMKFILNAATMLLRIALRECTHVNMSSGWSRPLKNVRKLSSLMEPDTKDKKSFSRPQGNVLQSRFSHFALMNCKKKTFFCSFFRKSNSLDHYSKNSNQERYCEHLSMDKIVIALYGIYLGNVIFQL